MFSRKIEWPSKEILEEKIRTQSILSIGRELGVSDTSVRKMAKSYGIDIKSISTFSKKHGSS